MSPLSTNTTASSTADRSTRNVILETGLIRGMAMRAPGSDERNQERNAMNRMAGFRQMATFRQPLEQAGAACRNRVWMIASPQMAAAPDHRLDRDRAEALLTGENQLLERLGQGAKPEAISAAVVRLVEGVLRDLF